MQTQDREALTKLYEDRYSELGQDIRTLGWRSVEDQRLRFQVLCDIADLSGARICDIGCGFGDLLPYLNERFGEVSYTGIDICGSFIERARELHPDHRFLKLDILEDPFEEHFDYFLLSGALNFRVSDSLWLTTSMITRMFELADKGVAVNFLSSFVNFERPHNVHHDPMEMFAFGKSLTKWVSLRHDYPLWEFTLHLYKEPQPLRSA